MIVLNIDNNKKWAPNEYIIMIFIVMAAGNSALHDRNKSLFILF